MTVPMTAPKFVPKFVPALTIRARITLAALCLMLFVCGFGAFTINRLDLLTGATDTIRSSSLAGTRVAGQLLAAAQSHRIAEAAYALSTNAMQFGQVEGSHKAAAEAVASLRDQAGRLFAAGPLAEKLIGFDGAWSEYRQHADRVKELAKEGNSQSAVSVFKRPSAVAFTKVQDSLNALVQASTEEADRIADDGAAIYREAETFVLAALALCALAVAASGALLVRSISRPILRVADALDRLAARDLGVSFDEPERRDEVGRIVAAARIFRESMLEADRLQAEQEQLKLAATEERRRELDRLAGSFEATVMALVETLGSSTAGMAKDAAGLMAMASDTAEHAQAVSDGVERVSANTDSVAGASAQLSASFTEIGRLVAESATIVHTAGGDADRGAQVIGGLAAAAQEIGKVVELISGIAGQTNLGAGDPDRPGHRRNPDPHRRDPNRLGHRGGGHRRRHPHGGADRRHRGAHLQRGVAADRGGGGDYRQHPRFGVRHARRGRQRLGDGPGGGGGPPHLGRHGRNRRRHLRRGGADAAGGFGFPGRAEDGMIR